MVQASLALPATAQEPTTEPVVAETAPPVPADPRIARVRGLIAGTLDVDVAPQTLFDVALTDEAAVQIEAARVRALLHAVEEAEQPLPPPSRRRAKTPVPEPDGLRADLAALDPTLWGDRLELDRARLDFYVLDVAQRTQLLQTHADREEAARPKETDEARQAREAEAERVQALAAAAAARTEAERLVAEELARLVTFETQVRGIREGFATAREQIAVRRDTVLGWQRRVRDAATAPDADSTYDALRRVLRSSRTDLAAALDVLGNEQSVVPPLGKDPLFDLPADVATEAARDRRVAVATALLAARVDEAALDDERASALLNEINNLNRERLSLLSRLSLSKREAITGFTAAGWEQATSEARQLSLILRYHRHVASAAISILRNGGDAGVTAWGAVAIVVPLALLLATFVWARRRTKALLQWADARMEVTERAERRTTPSFARRALGVLSKIHRPLEWAAFFVCVLWVLPVSVRALLEVQLIASVIGWSLAGSLVINTIDAVADANTTNRMPFQEGEPGKLRLRSLRLVGGTVIVFALILVLSSRLVGEGTIYNWVFSTCWFAAIPVFLLLVRWWRGTVFERLDRLRKKTPLQEWVLANRSGWKSFAAAMLGAVQLFVSGAVRQVRTSVSNFDLTRRVHAYFYKRDIERKGEGQVQTTFSPLPATALLQLHPERAFTTWLACPTDPIREALTTRAQQRRGGVCVVVAARGMGKTTLLRRLLQDVPDTAIVPSVLDSDVAAFAAVLGEDAAAAPSLVVIDDAQVLIEARIGGFARFDEITAFARAHGDTTTWVFAIDASVWPLLKRARDARPMFDAVHVLPPWNEVQLGALITDRCAAAGITPNYDDLLDSLPPGADDIDRQDAVNDKRVGYERMLWDHVGGNPGLAMQSWRTSLAQDDAGVVHVRPLRVPDITKLEALPDSSLFVLRAVLQLAPTTIERVAQATHLRPDEVMQDLRFGKALGLYDEDHGYVRISWPWLRAVTRHLQRRHLVVSL